MRKSMKKIISAAIAAMTVATLALTAFAADYAVPPSFGTAPYHPVSVTTNDLKDALDNAEAGADVSVSVDSVGSLTINPNVLKAIDKAEAVLEIVSPEATISIDASTIEKTRKLDLSMHIYGSSDRTVVKMRNKKELGCEVTIILNDCKMSAEKLAEANLYHNGKKVGPVELNEEGKPVITATEGGTYVIK